MSKKPRNRNRTRAIRERMRHTGETYTIAANALTNRPRLQLPLPPAVTGNGACRACAGAGVTDDVVDFDQPDATAVIVCWVLCPECLGCGHSTHDRCRARDHADPEHLSLDPYDDEDEDEVGGEGQEQCYSCRGRRWWPMQAFDDNNVYWVRTPCGCTENILVPA